MAVVVGSALNAGCNPNCKGPGCEDSWPAARVVVHRGDVPLPVGTLDAVDDARGAYEGTEADGAEWWVTGFGSAVVIGQPHADQVVRVADRTTTGPVDPQARVIGPVNTSFGASVAAVPFGDEVALLVAAPADSFGRGALYVVRDAGALAGEIVVTEADVLVRGSSPGDRLGTRITPCADVTGDGIADLAVSIPWFTTPDDPRWIHPDVPALAGAVLLISSEDVFAALAGEETAPWELGRLWWGTESGEGAGTSVACDRDLSGDGIADVVIGSPWANATDGRITVQLGGIDLPEDGPLPEDNVTLSDGITRVLEGTAEGASWFGIALTTLEIGDPPLVLVAVGAAGAVGGAGRVHLYSGQNELTNPDRLVPRRRATFESPADRTLPDHFGRWLAAGDLDADGQQELVIGAPDYKLGPDGFDAGRLWVFEGASSPDWDLTTAAEEASLVIEGSHAFERVGRAPHLHDIDQDGDEDLLLPTRARSAE